MEMQMSKCLTKKSVTELALDYSICRLSRVGVLLASDITRAVGCSKPTAIRVYNDLLNKYGDNLRKSGPRLIVTKMHDYWLSVATEKQLADAILNGGHEIDTGLTTHRVSNRHAELPINIHNFSSISAGNGVLTQVVKCLSMQILDHRSSLKINYVSMSKLEHAKWRLIVPLGIERVLEQWRVVAHDIESDGFKIKTYVLSRIIDYRVAVEPLPKKFTKRDFLFAKKMFEIELNNDLTKDQKQVIERELKIENNQIQIDDRIKFEYLRRFGSAEVSANAVWPIVTKIGEKKCM